MTVTVAPTPGGGIIPPAGDIGGTSASPTVVSLNGGQNLPSPLPTTKRVTMTLAGDTAINNVQAQWNDVLQRWPIILPVTPTRFRLRVRSGPANPAIAITGLYVGKPSYPAATGLWNANGQAGFTAAPTQLLGAANTTAGSEYVSGWITNSGYITADVPALLSFGFTQSGGSVYSQQTSIGQTWAQTGASALVGTQNVTGLSGGWNGMGSVLDVRLEYEFVGTNHVVLCVGDSLTYGYNDPGESFNGPCNTWPAIAGLRDRFCWINAGVGSTQASNWAGALFTAMTSRFDLTTTPPDVAFLTLGTNDANANVTAAIYEQNMTTVINNLRGVNPNIRIFLGVPPPCPGTSRKAGVLTAGAASAVSSLTTTRAYAATDVVDIGFGTSNYEQLTVNTGGSTGSGPYTTPLTASTAHVHAAGETISLTAQSRARDYAKWLRQLPDGVEGVFDFSAELSAPAFAGGDAFYESGIAKAEYIASTHPGTPGYTAMASRAHVPASL